LHDVAVLGDCCPDIILSGDVDPRFGQAEQLVSGEILVGGSGAIFAAGAARLGLRTALLATLGSDSFGRGLLEELGERGVDTGGVVVLEGERTGLSVILDRGGDRAILTSMGTFSMLRRELIDKELLSGARHVHVSSYFLQTELRPQLPELLAGIRERGATVSLDTNWDPAERWSGLEEVLPHVSWFLPNEEEARRISGEDDVEAAARSLARSAEVVVVKLGGEGALAVTGDAVVREPGIAADPLDTVGAGDSFDAGFVAARLRDWPLSRCLAFACACGALSTAGRGGTAAQPRFDQALAAAGLAADR